MEKRQRSKLGDYSIYHTNYTDELGKELFPLWFQHEEEAGLGYQLSPRFEVFTEDNYTYFVMCFGKEVVGYMAFSIVQHHHYDLVIAQQDLFFIRKDHRSLTLAGWMLKYTEQALKELDIRIDAIVQSSRPQKNLSKLFERYGYKQVDILHMKRL